MKSSQVIDIRDAFFDALYDLAVIDKDFLFLTADMSAFSLEKFKDQLPDQYFNVGVAEQNLMSVAAGLALAGKKVFAYAIAPFVTQRCFEQIKIDICRMDLPVTIVGSGPGLCYGSDGATHHAIEDLGMMRSLSNMCILNPSDHATAAAAAKMGYAASGPVYVRLDKGSHQLLHADESDFQNGVFRLMEGDEPLIVSTGQMVHQSIELARALRDKGFSAGVIDLFRIQPLERQIFIKTLQDAATVVTYEEHTLIGGIGSIISEIIAQENLSIPLLCIAITGGQCSRYGSRDWMQAQLGLDVKAAQRSITEWMGGQKRKAF